MRVSVFCGVSIDGFLAREDDALDFLDAAGDEDHGYHAFFATIDAIVVGRRTLDVVLGFPEWPYAGKRVIALTHRPVERDGIETHAGALAPLFDRLAREGVARVYLDGGVAIQHGLDEDVIDDLTISTVPVTIGAGRPLFAPAAPRRGQRWRLTASRSFASGLVQATYERARDLDGTATPIAAS